MKLFQLGVVFPLWVVALSAQIVPDRYVVELSEAPLGAEVRTKGKAALVDRQQAILTEQAQARRAVEAKRGKITGSLDSLMNALIVRMPAQEAAALSAIPGVKQVYPVRRMQAQLDRALALHQVPAAWSLVGGRDRAGAGVKIAILDTGISPNHPGFQDPALRFPAGFPRASSDTNLKLTNSKIIVARSYEDLYDLDEPDDARDRNGHGTAVAMCAAGVTNQGPLASITGVAPKAWIGGYKISPLSEREAATDVIVKALDDALADGMDIINLSFGSLFEFETGPDLLPGVAFERLKNFGVMVILSAGNDGPTLNSISGEAMSPSVISVGATQSDREFRDTVDVAGETYRAFVGTGDRPTSSVSGRVFDVEAVDPTGFLCSPAAAGSLSGRVALILRGVCTFEEKINNAQAGGAIAVILYTDAARPDGFTPAVGTAKLPAVMVSYPAGKAIQLAAQAGTAIATLPFKPSAFSRDFRELGTFSSRGPTTEFRIKPDLVATGANIYTATQSLDAEGEIYSKDGFTTIQGTSFSAPIVAGAAAVLRAARPGLTVAQYNSLLINGATPLMVNGGPLVERVQKTGTGVLNLQSALQNTVTLFPTALTWGVGDGVLSTENGSFTQLAVTNIGRVRDTFRIRSIPYDQAPALRFATTLFAAAPELVHTLVVEPGQTRTVYAYWTANLPRGAEYQGQILVEGTSTAALAPYWYGVPSLVPDAVLPLNPPPPSARVGATVTTFVRVVDPIGFPLTTNAQLRFLSTASAGATITLLPQLFYPNLRAIQVRLAPTARANTFQFRFGDAPPVTWTINGVPAP